MAKQDDDDGAWHLDKKVPIAILAAIIMQGVVGVWWVSKLDSRVAHLEVTDSSSRVRLDRIEVDRTDALGRVIRLEEQVKAMVDGLRRVEGKLDTLSDRLQRP